MVFSSRRSSARALSAHCSSSDQLSPDSRCWGGEEGRGAGHSREAEVMESRTYSGTVVGGAGGLHA